MPVSAVGRLAALYFFYFAFIGAFAPYFSLYLQDIGRTAWEIGLLMSVPQVMRLVAPNLWGWLADHIGRRALIVKLAAVFSALAFCVFFFSREFTAMLLAMALVWFFWSAALPLIEAMTLEHLSGRTERYGRVRLWGSVGFIVSVTLVGLLLDYLPIATLLWASWLILLSVALTSLSLRDKPVQHSSNQPPLTGLLRQPQVIVLLLACFLMSVAHGPLYVFYSIHLADHNKPPMVFHCLKRVVIRDN